MKRLVVALMCVTLIAIAFLAAQQPAVFAQSPTVKRTVILSAGVGKDATTGKWSSESGPFLNALVNPVDVSKSIPNCGQVYEGTIFNQPVAIASQGSPGSGASGKVNAALCAENLIRYYNGVDGIKEFLWSGIAGITPMKGGMVDNQNKLRSDDKIVIGDVCIGFVLKDYDLQRSSIAEGAWWGGETSTNPSSKAAGSLALAQELYQAGQKATWPDVPDGPKTNIAKYHGDQAVRKATVLAPNVCGEITADNFWHGVAEDRQSRILVSGLISETLKQPTTADQITILTAMEGTGWARALTMYTKNTGKVIPWAYSRSASNYDHPWFVPGTTTPAVTGMESINAGMSAGGGSPYGAITAAVPVLKMLELRQAQK